ncbi:DNA helicase [Sporosarcina sp. BI001-red]|uniref:DEAD/DEAH box helicase n=1 Tax=Sporosarcina sp. BI001-red TaxID=2282866 RepID=UPI000E23B0F2|nr:DEAD/DEAH box helicase [Sporosarcina sp. BI001-red]REB11641.1 DNA helicase [Sporosarcina sp. BI001-red]
MDNHISAWAFLESILPGEVPTLKEDINGSEFKDGKTRKRVNSRDVFENRNETLIPFNTEKYVLSYSYYLDCYEQDSLVQLFRNFFNSDEEIINKTSKRCYSFTFKVNESKEYVEGSLFIPHVQLVMHDILNKESIQYDKFSDRYEEEKNRVEEAAKSIFSDGVNPKGICEFRQVFRKHFGTLSSIEDDGYIGINFENKKNPQSAPLFNSFYLNDLHRILQKGTNETLQQFLDGKQLEIDIDENQDAIEDVLLPENLPLGRWPSPVAHRLSLMQQVAVNQLLNGNEKISSVNGPPGTGKTTLLKDVFAQLVVERAIQMTTYNKPSEAFTQIGKLKIEHMNFNMYELDEELAQHSIVVASSNNGAVENISKDLPKLDSVVRNSKEPTEQECREEFARSGADLLYQHQCEVAYREEATALDFYPELSAEIIQDEQTWGLFSAALGRSSNITSVSKALNGIRAKTNEGEEQKPKLTSLVKRFEEPLPDSAWSEVVNEFNELKQSVELKKQELQQFVELMKQAEDILARKKQNAQELEDTKVDLQRAKQQISRVEQQKQLVQEQLNILPAPSVWRKIMSLFSKKADEEEQKIREELNVLIKEQKELVKSIHNCEQKHEKLTAKAQHYKKRLDELAIWKEKYSKQQLIHSNAEFWGEEMYEERQIAVLWQTDELNYERGLLFLKALKVHKVFIAMNPRQIKAALAVLSNRQGINLNIDENKKYMANMWNVLHLVFPVVSTTFASFSSMYKGIEKDFIGYLFVDEAGQASPQQAAGALWRSKRAIVVGDPIQIEPVVTLDETILHDVRKAFDVSEAYIGTTASVQTLADFANPIGTLKGEGDERQRIGIPLWVHRRCIEPMFSIANSIAYQNKMVLPIKKIGEGEWFDCPGKAVQGQYVQEQGELIVEKIRGHFTVAEGTNKMPSVFVITPFTAVKDALKKIVKQQLNGEFEALDDWINRSIGTVHTFQGKEADIVYFVTGTDAETDGAADWSCMKPNLLNVAVTRAKKEFYVIGDAKRFQAKDHYNLIQQSFNEFTEKKRELVQSID